MKAQASAAGKRVPTSLQTKSSSALISLAVSFHLTMTKQQAKWVFLQQQWGILCCNCRCRLLRYHNRSTWQPDMWSIGISERVGSYSNVGDVVLGGDGTGSGGGSTSPSIMQRMAAKRRKKSDLLMEFVLHGHPLSPFPKPTYSFCLYISMHAHIRMYYLFIYLCIHLCKFFILNNKA